MATLHVRNVPDALYDALRGCAEAEGRSIGAQTVAILEDALVEVGPRRLGRFRRRLRRASSFARFTATARRVVVLAQAEARGLEHDYVGTEHLLLGLLRVDDDLVAQALRALGVELESVRARVLEIVGRGEGATPGEIPFTPRAKKVLELALREALALGDDDIATQHLALALASEREGVAARVLEQLGADAERVRAEVLGIVARRPPSLRPPVVAGDAEDVDVEYVAVELEGTPERWTEQLNGVARGGWQLVHVLPVDRAARAVFRRR